MPDIEQRFWQSYKNRGLQVIALNPREKTDQIGLVQQYCENLHVTYAIGVEDPASTYAAVTANFEGPNPFPVDVIIDKNGMVRYVTHEYDPDAMTEVIEQLLAE